MDLWNSSRDTTELNKQLLTVQTTSERIDLLLDLAMCYRQDPKCLPLLDEVEQLLVEEQAPLLKQRADVAYIRGRWFDSQHDALLTLKYIQQARDLYVEIGDRSGEAGALLMIAHCHANLNELADARRVAEQCRTIIEHNLFPPKVSGYVFNILAFIYSQMRLYDLAEQYCVQMIELGRTLSDDFLQAHGLFTFGRTRLAQERYEDARMYAREGFDIVKISNVDQWKAIGLHLLSLCHVKSGQHKKAITDLEMITDFKRVPPETHQAYSDCYIILGEAYLEDGQYANAQKWLEYALSLLPESLKGQRADCKKALGELFAQQGNYEEAFRCITQYAEWMTAYWEDERQQMSARSAAKHEYAMKKQEADLLGQKNRSLQKAYNEQKELLHLVAHDLYNPLQVILLGKEMSSRYLSNDKPAQIPQALDDIEESAMFMGDVIGQLRKMGDVDEGRIQIEKEVIDLLEMTVGVMERNRLMAEQKQIEIVFDAPQPAATMADRVMLQQMFENLLSNSIKYSPPNTQVILKVRPKPDNRVEIQCIDQGVGMALDELATLFTKFGRLPSSRPTNEERSTGLGLYITKKQIEAMDGTISVTSKGLGKGSTFTVMLPMAV